MHISIQWHGDQFNINLHSQEGKEEFLSIKGCRIKESGGKEFVSMPATKSEKSGKWWNHAWASEPFQNTVIALAKKSMPRAAAEKRVNDIDDQIPF